MYTVIVDFGQVVRDVDNVVVAPCQSTQEVDYMLYMMWIENGGVPRNSCIRENT